MKHLLYLNKEYLYSYYAQAFDGIDKTHQKEVSDATLTKEEHLSEDVSRSQNFEVGIGPFKYNASKDVLDESINSSFLTLEAARDAATVSLHDNALNRIIAHSKADEHTAPVLGEYVIEKGNFSILDMQYLIDMTSERVINFFAEESWNAHLKTLPNPHADSVQKGKKSFIQEKKASMTAANVKFQSLKDLALFDALLIVNQTLVPLKYEYMKESAKEIIFKYESSVSVFGRITRKNHAIQNNRMGVVGDLNEIWF